MPLLANPTPPQVLAPIPTGGLATSDVVVIVVYLAAMMGMGLAIARRQKTTDDFFLGGRNLPAWAVGISFVLCKVMNAVSPLPRVY